MRISHSVFVVVALVGTACGAVDDATEPDSASDEAGVAPATDARANRLVDAAATPMVAPQTPTPWTPLLDAGLLNPEICSVLQLRSDAGTAEGDCVIPCRKEWAVGLCKRPNDILVSIDGRTREQEDAADGWHWGADQCTVILVGAACDDVRAGRLLEIYARCVPSIFC